MQNLISKVNQDIFLRIWFTPRQVFRFLHKQEYDKFVPFLLVLGGIASSFENAIKENWGDENSLYFIIGSSIILGGALGWLGIYIYAALVSWSGKWIGGNARTKQVLRVFSYAMIPGIVSLILIILEIAFFGIAVFQTEVTESRGVWQYFFSVHYLILGFWSFILSVVGISEVQNFGKLKAFLNLCLPAAFILIPILIIVLISQLGT